MRTRPTQRPKIEQYGDALFIVARTAQLGMRWAVLVISTRGVAVSG
jgi:hypothetical protein